MKYLDNYGDALDEETVKKIAAALRSASRSEVSEQFDVPQKTLRRIASAEGVRRS